MTDKHIIAIGSIVVIVITSFACCKQISPIQAKDEPYIPIAYAQAFDEEEPDTIPVLESGETPLPSCVTVDEPTKKFIGDYKATFYCNCQKCCGKWSGGNTASGTRPTEGRTIAVDKNKIKLGTKLYLEFESAEMSQYNGEYIAEDTGSAIKKNKIDVFVGSHREALNCGVKSVKIWEV